jgi:hypothetical protein
MSENELGRILPTVMWLVSLLTGSPIVPITMPDKNNISLHTFSIVGHESMSVNCARISQRYEQLKTVLAQLQ